MLARACLAAEAEVEVAPLALPDELPQQVRLAPPAQLARQVATPLPAARLAAQSAEQLAGQLAGQPAVQLAPQLEAAAQRSALEPEPRKHLESARAEPGTRESSQQQESREK